MLLAGMPEIAAGLAALTVNDPDFAAVMAINGPLHFTQKPGGYGGLLRVIAGQQVSVIAAEAIWKKLCATANPLTPQTMLDLSDDALRVCGFSRQKIRYAKGLAEDISSGRLDFNMLTEMDDEAAISLLTQSVGIGRWTAENYLLFCYARPDIFPAKDLAILIGLEWLKGFGHRPTPAEAFDYAKRWAPYRTAASLLLWHHYIGEVKRRQDAKRAPIIP